MMDARNLKIGIMTEAQYRQRVLAIAKGEYKPSPDEPRVWFSSIKSASEVLSESNQKLLVIMDEQKPSSLKELEKLTGRKVSNLSRTLHTLQRYGIVRLHKHGRRIIPEAQATAFNIVINAYDSIPKSKAA